MVKANELRRHFLLNDPAATIQLNFDGNSTGTLVHIGYGYGHLAHFLLSTPDGKYYPVAANSNGDVQVKPKSWAVNIQGYPVAMNLLADDQTNFIIGSLSSISQSIADEGAKLINGGFVAVKNGMQYSVNGGSLSVSLPSAAVATTLGGTLAAVPSVAPTGANVGWWVLNKSWALPTIVGGVILVIGGIAYWAFKKK